MFVLHKRGLHSRKSMVRNASFELITAEGFCEDDSLEDVALLLGVTHKVIT